ncbi:hypothetical protein ACN47E_007580 [Coniothyrium glycines]
MNSKSLRRLAADHGSLHTAGLPPNYLFPASSDGSADLTSLDVLLAGPVGTPYASGVWRLHLDIPPTYPAAPPTAQFRTRLWHPNIDEATGAVCVETLKRDWSSTLKLRDVLVTISCLLIQPNPASALNEAAGKLATEDWDTYCRRAKLMTEIHAAVPRDMMEEVKEAQMRGDDRSTGAEPSGAKPKPTPRDKPSAKTTPPVSKVHRLEAEDEENARRRGTTQDPDSDPDRDWIPGPNHASASAATQPTNIFGIQGLDASTQPPPPFPRVFINNNNNNDDEDDDEETTNPFIPVTPKHTTHTFDPRPPIAATPTAEHPRALPKFSHRNPFSALQPTRPTPPHILVQEFSYTWDDARAVHAGGGAADARKRLASGAFEDKRRWEGKRFRAAGWDLGRYNRGDFGPRKGVGRL